MVVAFMCMEIEGVSTPVVADALVVHFWYRWLIIKLPKTETCDCYYIPMSQEQYMGCMAQYLSSRETVMNLTNFIGYATDISKSKKEQVEAYCIEHNSRV